jgi:two-component system, sensor histidine kinase YesM
MERIRAGIAAATRRLMVFATRRLAVKLVLLFTSIIILVVGSLSFLSYKRIEAIAVESSIASNTSNLKLVNRNFSKYFAEMDPITVPLLQYDQVLNAIYNEEDDYRAQLYLENYLLEVFYSRPDIEGVYLYILGSSKYYHITRQEQELKVRVKEDAAIQEREWFKLALDSKVNKYVESLLGTSDTGYGINKEAVFMAYHRTLRQLTSREPQAVLSFYFNPSMRNSIIQDIPMDKGEHVVFYNAEQVPFYMDDPVFYAAMREGGFFGNQAVPASSRSFTWKKDGSSFKVFADVSQENGWSLVKLVPYEGMYRAARTNTRLSLTAGLLFLLVSTLLVVLTSNEITKPLKRLSRKMSKFAEGRFDVELEVTGRDEIAHLSRQFNKMAAETNELINERYKMKLVEKNAILKALEAEINPHFLYNALQAVSTKALKNGMFDIADMVDALALSLRYCISGRDIVRLRDELKHIDHYITIQKARFGERLQVEYDLDEEASQMEIPKLAVQSLVENAIKHGLEKVANTVTVSIRAYLEGQRTIISVTDNGPGISEQKLDEIRRSFEAEWEERGNESIGLVNLNARLKLIYGDGARLDIASGGEGTEMKLILPGNGERRYSDDTGSDH